MIRDYLDFRAYLRAYFEFLKATKPGTSYQTIAQKFDLGSHSHLYDVIHGRKLTPAYLDRYASMLGLDGNDRNYFQAMVEYGQTKDAGRKNQYLQKLIALAPHHRELRLDAQAVEFFKTPIATLMLNMLALHRRVRDHKLLAKFFVPRITAIEARKALQTLEALDFVAWDGDSGQWNFTAKHLKYSEQLQQTVLRDFHLGSLELGLRHYRDNHKHQKLSTLTVATSEAVRERINEKIRELRREIIQLVKDEEKIETVLQINFQNLTVSGNFIPRRKRRKT